MDKKNNKPVCALMCKFKEVWWLNCLPHMSQVNFFNPVCVLIWLYKLPLVLKDMWHCKHGYGLKIQVNFRLKLFIVLDQQEVLIIIY